MSLFFRMALSIISALLSGVAASTVTMLMAIPATIGPKDIAVGDHNMMLVSFPHAPAFVGVSVFLIILCRDARGEYLRRD